MQKRRFEYQNRAENSHKFWEVETTGNDTVVRYGRITAEGSVQVKMFRSEREAESYAYKMINEKLGKGYLEVRAASNSGPTTARAAAAARASTATPTTPVPVATAPAVGARRRAIRLME